MLASIDDMFFKFVENPAAWGFIGLLLLAFMLDRILTFRFYRQVIHREQSDVDADNKRQQDLINLIGGTLSDIKKAIDNNTQAFNLFAASHTELKDTVAQSNSELKAAINQILVGVNKITVSLSDIRGSNQREYDELRTMLQNTIDRVEKLIQELPNGTSEDTDASSAGSSG
jgi:ABC-type transporter Mla subunit MlaD